LFPESLFGGLGFIFCSQFGADFWTFRVLFADNRRNWVFNTHSDSLGEISFFPLFLIGDIRNEISGVPYRRTPTVYSSWTREWMYCAISETNAEIAGYCGVLKLNLTKDYKRSMNLFSHDEKK
jgi:hypothetical protein